MKFTHIEPLQYFNLMLGLPAEDHKDTRFVYFRVLQDSIFIANFNALFHDGTINEMSLSLISWHKVIDQVDELPTKEFSF